MSGYSHAIIIALSASVLLFQLNIGYVGVTTVS